MKTTYPETTEDWLNVADELERRAEEIRRAVQSETNLPVFAILHPDKDGAAILRYAFAALPQSAEDRMVYFKD